LALASPVAWLPRLVSALSLWKREEEWIWLLFRSLSSQTYFILFYFIFYIEYIFPLVVLDIGVVIFLPCAKDYCCRFELLI